MFLAAWQKLTAKEVWASSLLNAHKVFKKESNQMKSYNHLFEKLVSRENIDLAITNASKRKRKRKDVRFILENKEEFTKRIQDLLINQEFKPQRHKLVKIYDKSSKKERYIIQPFFRVNRQGEEVFEQIIHHAVIQVLQPVFMKGMYKYSCGSIPKRGGHYGKRYLEKYIKEHNNNDIKYCCKFDIRHYYLTVNIPLLKEKFKAKIHDEKMLKIIFAILDSNIATNNGKLFDMGLPIGFYTSQWFANWFLEDFDHFIKEELKIKCYVRYVDDVILLSPNKKDLHKKLKRIKNFLKNIKLDLKKNYQVFKFDYGNNKGRPLDFMGFKFYRTRTTLRKSILHNAVRKARKIQKKITPTHYDASQMLSYLGWFKSTKTFEFFERTVAQMINLKACKLLISRKNKGETNVIKLGSCGKH